MIKIVFLIYPLLWLAITLVDTELANFKKYSRKLNGLPKQLVYPFVGRQIVNNIFGGGSGKKFYSFTPVAILALIFCIVIPFILPALISVFCFVVQARALLFKKVRPVGSSNRISQRITVTILYLTALFFVCNTSFFVAIIISINNPGKERGVDLLAIHLTSVIMSFVNSAVNPIVLIVRGKKLRRFIKKLFS